MKNKTYISILLIIFCVHSQAQELISLDGIFEKHRSAEPVSKDIQLAINNYDIQRILDTLYKYLSSENINDRRLSYRFLNELVMRTNRDIQSLNAVYYLIDKGLTDKSSTLISIALDYLEKYPIELFDSRSKNRLASIIMNSPRHYKRIVMLSGQLKMQQLISYYENRLKSDSTINKRDIWALQLTLARMGDPAMVNCCIDKVKAIGINDQVAYNLIPDLLYIKDKLVTDYLLDELATPNFSCTSADPDNEIPIDCGYRLAEYVSPVIKDFPISVGASGDLDCNDYKQALIDIRAWIVQNRDSYKVMFEE